MVLAHVEVNDGQVVVVHDCQAFPRPGGGFRRRLCDRVEDFDRLAVVAAHVLKLTLQVQHGRRL